MDNHQYDRIIVRSDCLNRASAIANLIKTWHSSGSSDGISVVLGHHQLPKL